MKHFKTAFAEGDPRDFAGNARAIDLTVYETDEPYDPEHTCGDPATPCPPPPAQMDQT